MSVSAVVLAVLHNDSKMTVITRKTLLSFHEQIFDIALHSQLIEKCTFYYPH
jgi:hypothetical protein